MMIAFFVRTSLPLVEGIIFYNGQCYYGRGYSPSLPPSSQYPLPTLYIFPTLPLRSIEPKQKRSNTE